MNKIYKYRLPRDGQVVKVDDYVIEWLAVANQDEIPTAWAVVDVDMPKGQRVSQIVAWGTGWELPDEVWMDCEYIGTCEDRYGYVWHYFVDIADSGSLSATTSDSAYAIPSGWADTMTISLDEDALKQILGNTTSVWDGDRFTYTTTCADGACVTGNARLLRV
jgi:hypothetical protein